MRKDYQGKKKEGGKEGKEGVQGVGGDNSEEKGLGGLGKGDRKVRVCIYIKTWRKLQVILPPIILPYALVAMGVRGKGGVGGLVLSLGYRYCENIHNL